MNSSKKEIFFVTRISGNKSIFFGPSTNKSENKIYFCFLASGRIRFFFNNATGVCNPQCLFTLLLRYWEHFTVRVPLLRHGCPSYRGCVCDNWKPSFLPRLTFNWRTFSRRVTVRWWHQWAKNQVSNNQNSRNRWCQIVRGTICIALISLLVFSVSFIWKRVAIDF